MAAHNYFAEHDAAMSMPIPDVASAGSWSVLESGRIEIITTGVETRTLPSPVAAGVEITLELKTDGGTCTVTVTNGFDSLGTTSLVFDDAGDMVRLVSVASSSNYRWRLVTADGVEVPESPISAITLDDTSTIKFGTGSDVEMQFDGTTFNMGPTTGFWSDCPLVNWPGGHALAYEFFDDFTTLDVGTTYDPWTLGTNTNGTVILGIATTANTPGAGGYITFHVDGSAQYDYATLKATSAATGEMCRIVENSGQKLWYECNITVGTVTDCTFMVGLMDPAADDCTVDADGLEAVADGFYFRTALATETEIDTCTNQNTTESVIGDATGTAAANGNYTLGIKFDGVTTLTFYIDGVAQADTVTIGDTGNIPNDVGLTPVFHCKDGTAGGTADDLLHVDWVKLVQIR